MPTASVMTDGAAPAPTVDIHLHGSRVVEQTNDVRLVLQHSTIASQWPQTKRPIRSRRTSNPAGHAVFDDHLQRVFVPLHIAAKAVRLTAAP
jgi:hypothetical protein